MIDTSIKHHIHFRGKRLYVWLVLYLVIETHWSSANFEESFKAVKSDLHAIWNAHCAFLICGAAATRLACCSVIYKIAFTNFAVAVISWLPVEDWRFLVVVHLARCTCWGTSGCCRDPATELVRFGIDCWLHATENFLETVPEPEKKFKAKVTRKTQC